MSAKERSAPLPTSGVDAMQGHTVQTAHCLRRCAHYLTPPDLSPPGIPAHLVPLIETATKCQRARRSFGDWRQACALSWLGSRGGGARGGGARETSAGAGARAGRGGGGRRPWTGGARPSADARPAPSTVQGKEYRARQSCRLGHVCLCWHARGTKSALDSVRRQQPPHHGSHERGHLSNLCAVAWGARLSIPERGRGRLWHHSWI